MCGGAQMGGLSFCWHTPSAAGCSGQAVTLRTVFEAMQGMVISLGWLPGALLLPPALAASLASARGELRANWRHWLLRQQSQAGPRAPRPASRPPAMGQCLACCRAPDGAQSGEAVKRQGDLAVSHAANGARVTAEAVPASAAAAAGSFARRTSLGGYYSATGYSTDGDDEWHDALSDIGSGEYTTPAWACSRWAGGGAVPRFHRQEPPDTPSLVLLGPK